MVDISWLHFLILILASFSVNYLIINEMSIYFSEKSYLSKWILCFVSSILILLLKIYIPYSFIYLLAFAIAAGVQIIHEILFLARKQEGYKMKFEDIEKTFEIYENRIADLEDKKDTTNNNSKDGNLDVASKKKIQQRDEKNVASSLRTNIGVKDSKIINSTRTYKKQEFLNESEGQNVTLSPFLRSHLKNSNNTKR